MPLRLSLQHFWSSLSKVGTHAVITLLALGLAFSLPHAASYVLFDWWPKVRDDAQLMVATEIAFAGILVLALNLAKLAWHYRKAAHASAVASLVCACESGSGMPGKKSLLRALPWKRDITLMTVTGHRTFSAKDGVLNGLLGQCYEIRVMLLDPYGEAAQAYAATHADPAAALETMRREVRVSIECLKELRAAGKKVALKLYDDLPFWKLVFTGEHVWVRSCHGRCDDAAPPEYVFALQPEKPSRGFFPSFYTYFLNHWNDARHPDYAFDTDELVYRDPKGLRLRRVPYPEAPAIEATE